MKVKGFELKSLAKLEIVINGDGGKFLGVGESNEDAILAEYDKRGGFILKGGHKVKNGSFYDFRLKKAREKPVVEFVNRSGKKGPKVTVDEFGDDNSGKKGGKKAGAKKGGKKGGKKAGAKKGGKKGGK